MGKKLKTRLPSGWHNAALIALLLAALATTADAKPKRLIEMGWDEPDPAFMRAHLDQLEASPFDGCIYHVLYADPDGKSGRFTWEAWGTRAFNESELDSALRDLRATPFRRFRSNFLRMNVTPGRLDWFDDYGAVLSNATLAASIAKRGGSAGVMLDTEEYEGRLFEYPSQRDTAKHSYREYAEQARRRGAQIMHAFEQGYPGLTLFLTYSATLPYIESGGDRIRLGRGHYGLLVPFVDGLIEAASDSARIVDGMEASYPVRDLATLDIYLESETRGVLPWLSDSTRYRRTVSRSVAVWLDHDWTHRGWDTHDVSKNYRPPAALKAVVRRALELADDYVWVYSETPRWWTAAGGTKDLPEPYVRALRDARKGLTP